MGKIPKEMINRKKNTNGFKMYEEIFDSSNNRM